MKTVIFMAVTVAEFVIPLILFYAFGYFRDRRLINCSKTKKPGRIGRLIFHFDGDENNTKHSLLCIRSELFAIIQFILLCPCAFVLMKVTGADAMTVCKFCGIYTLLALVGFSVLNVYFVSYKKKRSNVKIPENFVSGTVKVPEMNPNPVKAKPKKQSFDEAEEEQAPVIPAAMAKARAVDFYRPVENDGKLDSMSGGRDTLSKANPLLKEGFIPVNISDGEGAEDFVQGMKIKRETPLLEGDIFVPFIPTDVRKFGTEEVTGDLAEEGNIEYGKQVLADTAKRHLEKESYGRAITRNDEYASFEGVSRLSEKKEEQEEIGSARSIIDRHKDEFDPEKQLSSLSDEINSGIARKNAVFDAPEVNQDGKEDE